MFITTIICTIVCFLGSLAISIVKVGRNCGSFTRAMKTTDVVFVALANILVMSASVMVSIIFGANWFAIMFAPFTLIAALLLRVEGRRVKFSSAFCVAGIGFLILSVFLTMLTVDRNHREQLAAIDSINDRVDSLEIVEEEPNFNFFELFDAWCEEHLTFNDEGKVICSCPVCNPPEEEEKPVSSSTNNISNSKPSKPAISTITFAGVINDSVSEVGEAFNMELHFSSPVTADQAWDAVYPSNEVYNGKELYGMMNVVKLNKEGTKYNISMQYLDLEERNVTVALKNSKGLQKVGNDPVVKFVKKEVVSSSTDTPRRDSTISWGNSSSGSSKPDTSKPDTSKPDTSKPDTSKPDTSKPDTSKPDTSEPEKLIPEINFAESDEDSTIRYFTVTNKDGSVTVVAKTATGVEIPVTNVYGDQYRYDLSQFADKGYSGDIIITVTGDSVETTQKGNPDRISSSQERKDNEIINEADQSTFTTEVVSEKQESSSSETEKAEEKVEQIEEENNDSTSSDTSSEVSVPEDVPVTNNPAEMEDLDQYISAEK